MSVKLCISFLKLMYLSVIGYCSSRNNITYFFKKNIRTKIELKIYEAIKICKKPIINSFLPSWASSKIYTSCYTPNHADSLVTVSSGRHGRRWRSRSSYGSLFAVGTGRRTEDGVTASNMMSTATCAIKWRSRSTTSSLTARSRRRCGSSCCKL